MLVKRPLVWAFVIFCTGIWMVHFLHVPVFFRLPTEHIANFTPEHSGEHYLKGVTVSDPTRQYKKHSFLLKSQGLKARGQQWQATEGLVQVNIYNPGENIRYGDQLLIKGVLQKPRTAANPGDFDYRRYLARKKIHSCMFIKKGGFARILERDKAGYIAGRIFNFKDGLRDQVLKYVPQQPQRAVLSGILLGDREGIPRRIKEKFINTGTVHILAISGLHVGLITFIFLSLFKILRIPAKISYPAIIFMLLAYSILTGGRPPIVRATIMSTVILLGFMLRRPVDIFNSLCLSGLIILCKNPSQLFDAGFQLSFIAVASIVYMTPRILGILSQRIPAMARNAFSVSMAAWLGALPVVMYYFNTISLIAIIANIFVIMLLAVIVCSGMVFLGLGSFSYTAGSVFAAASSGFVTCLLKLVDAFNAVPFGFFKVNRPPLLFIAAYYTVLIICMHSLTQRRSYGIK